MEQFIYSVLQVDLTAWPHAQSISVAVYERIQKGKPQSATPYRLSWNYSVNKSQTVYVPDLEANGQ